MGGPSKRRVVVISSDPEYSAVVQRLLTGAQYEAVAPPVADVPEAFAARMGPDVVVLDVAREDDARAWRTLARLVFDPVMAAVPVVLCAPTPTGRRVRALFAPIDDGALLAVLEAAVGAVGPVAAEGDVWAPLSRREQEVAVLVARGFTNRSIARALTIAEGTAANHVRRILLRLGLSSRSQITVWVTANAARRETVTPH